MSLEAMSSTNKYLDRLSWARRFRDVLAEIISDLGGACLLREACERLRSGGRPSFARTLASESVSITAEHAESAL
jgi:hypothetical protein